MNGKISTVAMRLRTPALALLGAAWMLAALAQEDLAGLVDDAHRQWVREESARRQAQAGADLKVWPAVFADRAQRRVEILALATGLDGEKPVEFFLVNEQGKTYEALLATLAQPRDVLAALEFLGLPPGLPHDPQANRFWPKGERVLFRVQWQDAQGQAREARVEEFLRQDEQPLPVSGLVFTGSNWFPAPAPGQPRGLAADATANIASTYNDRDVLLDVPRQAEQGRVYGHIVPNPARVLPRGQRVRCVLTPELPRGETRVRSYSARFVPAPAGDGQDPWLLNLADGGGRSLLNAAPMSKLLELLQQEIAARHDVFLSPAFAPELPVRDAIQIAAMLRVLAGRDLLRLEPVPGQLYYEAYLPRSEFWDRQQRLTQPLELYLADRAGQIAGHGIHLVEHFDNETVRLTEERFVFTSADELVKLLAAQPDWKTPVALFYVSRDARCGEVLALYERLHERCPLVYVMQRQVK